MTPKWQLHEAKNKFSKVVDDAMKGRAQVITGRGIQVAVVLDRFKTGY